MNLFQEIPENLHKETVDTIVQTEHITLERIVSKGHITPEGKWYDQTQDEWVMLLTGSATILFADREEIKLQQGDHLNIPAHRRHRVIETDTTCETIWLALHYTAS